jgi:predicted esterase
MKKLFCILLSALMLLSVTAGLAESATLNAEPFDWGEAITSLTIDLDEPVEGTPEVKVEATVTYMDYSIFANVTETKERVPEEVTVDGSKITVKLPYAALDAACTAYPNSTEIYKITVNGKEISNLTLADPAVDAFLEKTTGEINYRLFVPETDAEKVPMVVWLHGAGEQGADNRAQISANLVTNWATPEAQACFGGACYIMAPQAQGPHNPEKEMKAIEQVLAEYPNIDKDRIYVGGCSMGGGGTMSIITAYPDFFAAAFPICPAGSLDEETAAKFAANKMPVYLIHSIDDTTVNVSSSAAAYELLTKAGAEVHTTLFEHALTIGVPEEICMMLGHWSWTYVHRNFDAEGEDEDGRMYHAGEYVASGVNTNTLYNGEPLDYGKLNEGYSFYDQSTWTTYGGEPFNAELLGTEEVPYEYTCVSEKPADLGYPTFFDWLAAQHK